TETEVDAMLAGASGTAGAHASNTDNPHGVTAAQVGLGSVNNTSDLDKPVSTATQTALNGKANTSDTQPKLPVGTILMYDGTGWADNSTLPGWYQCNGQNGTPDLRDKFIRGGSSSGGTGGADSRSITLTTANLPEHSHGLSGSFTTGNESAGHTHSVTAAGTITGAGTHDHTISETAHSHGFDKTAKDDTGGGGTFQSIVCDENVDSTNTFDAVKTASVKTNVSVNSGEGTHSHTFSGTSVTSGGVSANHTHSVTLSGNTGNAGSATPTALSVDTVPSYYSMIYIRKCA
ncbi:phage tail fiber protein, partial [Candidatus Termititenax persephonae]